MMQMLSQDHGGAARRSWTFWEIALAAALVLLLVPNFNGVLHWGNEYGGSPIKPRDFNAALGLVVIVLACLNRPAFCLPGLALLTIPMLRFFDALVLQRYAPAEYADSAVFVLMLAGYLLVSLVAVFSLGASKGRQMAILVAALTIVTCAAANLYEWLGFAAFTRIPGRMAGWHIDPNESPIVMCLMLGILFTINGRYWWNLVLIGIAAVGIALTMSRSGMAVFAVMSGIYLILHLRERLIGMTIMGVLGIPLLIVCIGVLWASSDRQGILRNPDTAARMRAIYELDFEKLKSAERAKDLRDGWEAALKKPVLGYGVGAGTLQWWPHNQLVTQWIDLGIIGVAHYIGALLVVSLVCALKRLRGGFCLLPVWLFIPCSQVLIETPAYWYAAAVACAVLFPKRYSIRLRGERSALPAIATRLNA